LLFVLLWLFLTFVLVVTPMAREPSTGNKRLFSQDCLFF
jgi:hypothetical protein